MVVDIATIPTRKLGKDLQDSRNDICVCEAALDMGITSYSGGSVEERPKGNQHFVKVITKELNRRLDAKEARGGGD